jgi:benzil reductase ((S)-benzoin forming)
LNSDIESKNKSQLKPTSLYIITGSSKGIGKALVEMLIQDETKHIIGISRSASKTDAPNHHHIPLDLGNIEALVKSMGAIFPGGNFDQIVLINNAAWIGQVDHFGKLEPKSIQDIFNINTLAPALLMNEFVKRYSDSKSSERIVVNISSGAAKKPVDGWSGYCASKAALNMLTETAQKEAFLQSSGIRFFALSPGVVDTKMQEDIRSASQEGFSSLPKFQGLKEKNELSSPEFTAEKILFLIDNPSKFEEVLQDVRDF